MYSLLQSLRFRRPLLLGLSNVAALLSTLAIGATLYAQQPSPPFDASQVTIPLAPPLAAAGRASYAENCAPCHGAAGNADGPTAASLPAPATAFADSEVMWERTPAELFHTTKFGRVEKLMPPWASRLSDGEIWNTVAFAWSLHTSAQEMEKGRALYDDSCVACHGADGRGDGPEARDLAVDFTRLERVVFQSQADWLAAWQQAHPEIGRTWPRADQSAALQYIRSFSMKPPWQTNYRPGSGVISGRAVQRTPGGRDPAGSPVWLDAYVGFEPVAVFTSTVENDGRFEFRNLSLDPSLSYFVTVASDGVTFSSELINLTPITQTADVEVALFSVTDDPSAVVINRSHWIVEPQPGGLVVVQIYTVGNRADRAFVGQQVEGVDEPATIALPLPSGAVDLSVESGASERYRRVGDVLYDTAPLLPGDAARQIILRYAIPVTGDSAVLEQPFIYPVEQLTLLVADAPELKVDAPEMQFIAIEQFQNQAYQLFRKAGFDPQSIRLSLQGLAALGGNTSAGDVAVRNATAAPPMTPLTGWLFGGMTLAALLAALVAAFRLGRLNLRQSASDSLQTRDQLIDRIAHLDDLHAVGAMDDKEWRQERSRLKVLLVETATRAQQKG